jgi:hypothetical protein
MVERMAFTQSPRWRLSHAGDLQRLHVLDARVAEGLRHRLGGAPDLLGGKARGRHAGDAAKVHECLLPVIELRVEIAQSLAHHAVGLRHAHAPIMARSFAPLVSNQSKRMRTSQPMQK